MLHVLLAALMAAPGNVALDEGKEGHSSHGSAFDSGMRTKPWKMPGIGAAPFPITCKNAEVQAWYDQGNELLHSFWFEEAERAFRWCLKLVPENPMVYWSLARVGLNWFYNSSESRRYKDFLAEAVKREGSATERERMYIDAWAAAFKDGVSDSFGVLTDKLQLLMDKYPDDIEAKSLYALFHIGNEATRNELLIQQVLRANPDHPGAHHYRIHNWDHADPVSAIRSCEQYGLAAPAIGHANHMPGHIYSKIGMWNEAARSMDSATRLELRYMDDRLALPFETWDYAHNRNYLCYIQEQLGMPSASIRGARDLIESPRDPKLNSENAYKAYGQGMTALVRALIKFEKFDEVLKPDSIPWRDTSKDKKERAWAESIALAGLGRKEEALKRLADLKKAYGDKPGGSDTTTIEMASGLVKLYGGDPAGAADELKLASEGSQSRGDDPPDDAFSAHRLYADALLAKGDAKAAVTEYEKALKNEPNDAFCLAGMAKAHFALGDRIKATDFAGQLEYVWANAEGRLRWLDEVRNLHLNAKPHITTPAAERPYRPSDLAKLGPSNWEPFPAPELVCRDSKGKKVKLSDFRGRNVLLVFYLSEACVHCVEQLVAISKRSADFGKEDAVVLAVSSATPEKNRESDKLGNLGFTLLSDSNHENARRFASYDDFEDLELHSTILIDRQGKLRWKRTGGDPFTDMDFLLKELRRVNRPSGSSTR